MAVTYNPNHFVGSHYDTIFSTTLAQAKSLDYVNKMLNVKTEQSVTSFAASITEQDYASNFDPATASKGTVTVFDEKVRPVKKMFFNVVDPETLRFSRFGDSLMGEKASSLNINEFETKMLDVLVPQMARTIEEAFWADIKTLAQSKIPSGATGNTITKVAGGLTSGNIVAEVEKVWKKIPAAVRATGRCVIYADEAIKDLIMIANLQDNYKDRFVVNGDTVKFLGVEILFVPFKADVMLGANRDEVFFATDVMNDEASIEIGKVNNYGDQLFYKSVYTRDKAIVIPEQKVLYI